LKNQELKTPLSEGGHFGESCLMKENSDIRMTVKALEKTVCLIIEREKLIELLGDKINNILYR
jgi:hypothetical protein